MDLCKFSNNQSCHQARHPRILKTYVQNYPRNWIFQHLDSSFFINESHHFDWRIWGPRISTGLVFQTSCHLGWFPVKDYRQRYQLETSTNLWRQKKTLRWQLGTYHDISLRWKKTAWDLWYHHLIGSINLHQDLPVLCSHSNDSGKPLSLPAPTPTTCPNIKKHCVLLDKMHTSMIMAFILERTA